MDNKTNQKLELDKILKQLAEHAAFSASRELLEALEPTGKLNEAIRRQQITSEARNLLDENDRITVGGARDIRPHAGRAERGIALPPEHLLEVRATLEAARTLRETLGKAADRFPLLNEIALGLYEGRHIVDAVDRAINEQAQVLDSASSKLASIRSQLKSAHNRLQSKLQSIIGSGQYAPYLQESLVTQRGGRYVIPVKAESKGQVKGIVHDQSSSGATVYVEPLATVEINNEIRELEIAEEDEILRILHEISALIGDDADHIRWLVESLAALDAAFAMAKYAGVIRAHAPMLVGLAEDRVPGSTIKLYHARHPLIPQEKVVPIDVELDGDTYVLIITGPNTGGKTVSLKTVGLLTLMAQCGLHIPASPDSVVTVFDSVYADIGDEQSIEQSLSTFSAHLTHIIDILERADDRSLVLLDELGAGTDPTEGAAIARAILDDLRTRGVTTFVATHYPELKLYAHSTPGVRNASVEFDVETLSPTYRLIIGLPGRSNALAIATRLGLHEDIVQQARSFVGADDLSADDLLEEIHRTRREIHETQERLSLTEHDTVALRDQLQERLDEIDAERQRIIEQARAEANAELDIVKAELYELKKRLRAIPPSYRDQSDAISAVLQSVEADSVGLEDLITEPINRGTEAVPAPPTPFETPPDDGFQTGDRVFVPTLNAEGEIVGIDGDEAEVQVGQFRMRVRSENLEFRSRPQQAGRRQETGSDAVRVPRPDSPGIELHLRGMTVDEALPILEEYLDQAYLSGLPWVNIVHGKGTGVLRKEVRAALSQNPVVKEFKKAPSNEGGDGVTIVTFVPLA